MSIAALAGERAGAAQTEMARRELARQELTTFSWYTYRGYQVAPVHRLLAEYLEQVELYIATKGREGIGRLMVFMPPRHGKSELVSVRFPAWFLGRNPDCDVILASCTADLATGFSRQVRNIINDTPFQAVFGRNAGRGQPVMLSEDSRSANIWNLAPPHRGGLRAAGVGGAIIGRGAHLAVIDDPFKDRASAESSKIRDDVDAWYRSTLYTRLEDSGAVVLMHQRWHSDDQAGRLLRRMIEEEGADRWTVLNMPAIAEPWAREIDDPEEIIRALKEGWWMGVDPLKRAPGKALWQGKFPPEALENIKANIGGYEWDALYQQRPRPIEGAMIKAHQIILVLADEVPDNLREVRYWDLAVSGHEKADYIVGARVGRSERGGLYILNIARMPGPWADARPKMIEVMREDPVAVAQGIETSGQQAGYYQELQRDPQLQGRTLRGVSPAKAGNKEVRAQVWASRIPDGLVHIVKAPWNDEFVSEAISFPRGQHDDQVDAVSGAVQMLAMIPKMQSMTLDWYAPTQQVNGNSAGVPTRSDTEIARLLDVHQ